MFIDITTEITPLTVTNENGASIKAIGDHHGTHFDVMDKEFPLEYAERRGIVFDVAEAAEQGRDVDVSDINLEQVRKDMFVIFRTGFIEKVGYGGEGYFGHHPQLSDRLIDELVEKGVSMIGIDCAGVRRGDEHIPKDQYCADRGVFIIENLCHLQEVLANGPECTVYTLPLKAVGMAGLSCRVVVKY